MRQNDSLETALLAKVEDYRQKVLILSKWRIYFGEIEQENTVLEGWLSD